MKSDPRLTWLIRAIGLGLFVVLIVRSEPAAILAVLKRADPLPLSLAALLIFPMMALKTARWRNLQRAVGISGPTFGDSFRAYLEGLFAGLVTPGRVGEFVRVRSLTERGAPFGAAMATVIWDRIFDILGLLLLGSLAMYPLAGDFRGLYAAGLTLLAGGILLTGLILHLPVAAWRAPAGRLWATVPGSGSRLGNKIRESGGGLLAASRSFGGWLLVRVGVFTLAGWLVYYFQAWLLARTIHLDLAVLPLVVAVTAAAVAAFVPISISGIGTRDAALVVLFQGMGRTREEALAFSALVLLMLLVNALVGLAASRRR